MKKILFCDIDGTLYNKSELRNPKDQEYIKLLHEKGYYFSFCTGRNESEMAHISDGFDYDYAVLNNGATVIDNQGHILYEKKIPGDVGKKILDYLIANYPQLIISFYNGKETMSIENGKTYRFHAHDFVEVPGYNFKEGYNQMDAFDIICASNRNEDDKDVIEVRKYVNENYPDDAQGTLNLHYLDITAAHCTKGTGLNHLASLFDEEIETYCIGDSFNDISMFHEANKPYTFNHVNDEIKQHTCKQVDYVYQVMEDMLKED